MGQLVSSTIQYGTYKPWRQLSVVAYSTKQSTAFYIKRQQIENHTAVTRDHLTPEIKLRLITAACPLWKAQPEQCPFPDPYWAFYWPGGQALSRYILDQPAVVKGQRVLDIGCGCGATSLAAIISGALSVVANDICPFAVVAVNLNAELNQIKMEQLTTDSNNLVGRLDEGWSIILLGDMFYDIEFTTMISHWLEKLHEHGSKILIGDPGRIQFEKHPVTKRLRKIAEYELSQNCQQENNGLKYSSVWAYQL